MDDTSLLEKPYIRRYFYITIISLTLFFGVIRYLVLPSICKGECSDISMSPLGVIAALIDNLIPALITSLGISIFLVWILPPVEKKAAIFPVEPRLIGDLFEKARSNTSLWHYKGGTGTYLRAVTLAFMAKLARQKKSRISISIEILNPTNSALCDRYARYRRSVSESKTQTQWTKERTQVESYATILAVCILRAEEPLLDIRFGLSETMSVIRYDMSSDYLIITNEDPRAPALQVDRGTFYYEVYRDDLVRSLNQSKVVPLDKISGLFRDEISPAKVKDQFAQIDIDISSMSDGKIEEIIQKALSARNPYR